MPKVVIEVQGGVVSQVHTSDDEIQVVVIDWDDVDAGEELNDIQKECLGQIEEGTMGPLMGGN